MKQRGLKSLKAKILIGFLTVVGLSVILSSFMIMMMVFSDRQVENMIEKELPILVVDEQLALNMLERTSLLESYLLYENDTYREAFEQGLEEAIALEERALALSDSEELKKLIDLKVEWGMRTDQVFEMVDAGNVPQAQLFLQNQVNPIASQLVDGFKALAREREEAIEQIGEDVLSMGDMMIISSGIAIILIISVAVVIAYLVANSITKPLQKVTKRMHALSQGKLNHEPFEVRLRDESAQLMEATNELTLQMTVLIHQLNEVSTTVDRHSDELSQSAVEVSNGADQIALTMGELADGSESQATHASELSEGMHVLNSEMTEALNQGQKANDETSHVLSLTNEGQALMKASVDAMRDIDRVIKGSVTRVEELNTHATSITKMVGVIEDIAEQTNLLALNASIEAARAGEHGKGFSVVANEVRKLAEQVASSVKEITGTVDTIQSASSQVNVDLNEGYKVVKTGTDQINQTNATFNQINQAVDSTAKSINQIVSSLNHVSTETARLLSAVEEVASISEESAAGVEETSASVEEMNGSMQNISDGAKELTGLVDNLKEIIKHFEL
ncbi:hypothetical protein GCM10012290_17590 [Halolactibacillus alkaliphilus]|uniref:Methyl-accepting chemotaxis protein n=1 Tax=Halolactibacillus alkaliphilus TaxID=442899 RepID=A0A511X2E4_9BACI|nr:methyl-accepting chemotaxis protein [Halolactibacillus alkaliphilus]GEN57115.1 hypothetical protein HAL01_15790 [Halolactibacillus alkaliphilus]GGN72042.1 hypothetical protein GCM10012290_17590 [Halolactibacillus alkaliphilus]SFO86623.1 methyl-accepting chemotaxis protein [Halolactibacillus alkaliphilus]